MYEVVPDSSVTTINTRVCRAQVSNIGPNLPCIESNANYHIDPPVYNISDVTKTLNDYAVLDIGNACPSAASSSDPDANQFMVTGCIEMPRQTISNVPSKGFILFF